jgi:hypothetical protein
VYMQSAELRSTKFDRNGGKSFFSIAPFASSSCLKYLANKRTQHSKISRKAKIIFQPHVVLHKKNKNLKIKQN